MRPLTGLIAVTALLGITLHGQQQSSGPSATDRIDVSTLGPQVGERVPEFSLRDQNGRTQTLQSIMGARGAMLVFVRSADW